MDEVAVGEDHRSLVEEPPGDEDARTGEGSERPARTGVERVEELEARVLGLDIGEEGQVRLRRAQVPDRHARSRGDEEFSAVVDGQEETLGGRIGHG